MTNDMDQLIQEYLDDRDELQDATRHVREHAIRDFLDWIAESSNRSLNPDALLDTTHETVWMTRKDVAFLLHALSRIRQRESLSELSSTQIDDSIRRLEDSLKQRGNDGDE